jgi:hypothetical protein
LPTPSADPDEIGRLHVRRRHRLGGILHERELHGWGYRQAQCRYRFISARRSEYDLERLCQVTRGIE